MFSRIAAVMALLTLSLWAQGSDLRENEIIVGGGSCQADGLWISGPSVYLRQNLPGVVVGMAQMPGQENRFAYVLVIKGDEHRKIAAAYESKSEVTGSVAISQGHVKIGSRKVDFKYQIDINRQGTAAPREGWTINGTALDLQKGRVLLIDLSGDEVTWKQLPIELPRLITKPAQTAEVETQAKILLDAVKQSYRR